MIDSGALIIATFHPKIDPPINSNLYIQDDGAIVPDR